MGDLRDSRAPLGEGWSAEATSILDRAIMFHGGWDRWDRLQRIHLTPTSLTGGIPRLKGVGSTFPIPGAIEIAPHARQTIFHEYPERGQKGVFGNGSIRIESASDARIIAASVEHRSTFRGLSKNRRWSPLDALYFFGYALWHYHAIPFTLGDARLIRTVKSTVDGDTIDGLELVFPSDVPTHCSTQTFYFDQDGCIRRHDYVADIVGAWARGAHFWKNYQFVNGVAIASERHVRPFVLGQVLPATALRATFVDIRVDLSPPRAGAPESPSQR